MRYEPKEVILTEDELRSLCAEWQETLRLQDWDINVWIVRARDIDNASARVHWRQSTRDARISVQHPSDFEAEPGHEQDMERDLVHELLHLHFSPFAADDDDSAENIAQEQAIHALSCSLVALKRKADANET